MSNSCGGLDDSVPGEVEEALKAYIKKTKPRKHLDQGDQNDDMTYSCLLEDCGGQRCQKGKCHYNGTGDPTRNHKPHKPL